MKLSTKPYKGARDFYPEDKRLQKYLFSIWRTVVERYGYEEYDAPIIEPIEIYLAKSGEEIVNEQTYEFIDRGKRQVVIRPEMTPTVSRMVADKRQELAYPLRWYSIPNLWRYERPQNGRLREHWQLNVDVFGIKDVNAEIELLTLVDSIFKEFKASSDMYEIKLNHRGLTNYILKEYLGLEQAEMHKITKLVDRMNKMSKPDFISALDEILSSKQKEEGITEKLMSILSKDKIAELPEAVKKNESYKELVQVISELKDLDITNVKYDPSIMRGFDYYSGLVFEVTDNDPDNNRAMLGGGRYDGLVGLFGVSPVPTVGFGWGDVTLINFLKGHHLLDKLEPETEIYVALIADVASKSSKVVQDLRRHGINVAVDYSGRKLGDQLKTADKKGISRVLIIGEEELKTNKFKLKDLNSAIEEELSLEDLIKVLK
jgi:histidyl-tRNA synthetase